MRPETATWWRQATSEWKRRESRVSDTISLRGSHCVALIAWLAQQSIENGLKALYIEHHAVLAPRTHNLTYLGEQIGVSPEIAADLQALDPAFGNARYPDPNTNRAPVDDVPAQEAESYLSAAERITAWVAIQLSSSPTGTP